MRGYTEIYFFPADEVPVRHAGEFRDKEHISVRFYARRLPVGARRLRTERERFEAARAFWESIAPDIRKIARREVSADWE